MVRWFAWSLPIVPRRGHASLCGYPVFKSAKETVRHQPESPWVTDSDEDFLYHVGAAACDGKGTIRPTRAGLLAFGYEYEITDYLPQYLLDYREEADDSDRWSDRVYSMSGDWSGNIIDFYLTVSQRLKSHFKAPFGTDEFGSRTRRATPLPKPQTKPSPMPLFTHTTGARARSRWFSRTPSWK